MSDGRWEYGYLNLADNRKPYKLGTMDTYEQVIQEWMNATRT